MHVTQDQNNGEYQGCDVARDAVQSDMTINVSEKRTAAIFRAGVPAYRTEGRTGQMQYTGVNLFYDSQDNATRAGLP